MRPLSFLPVILTSLFLNQAVAASQGPVAHLDCLPGRVVVKLRAPHMAGLGRVQSGAGNVRWFDIQGMELRRIEAVLPPATGGVKDVSTSLTNVYILDYEGDRDPREVAAALAKRPEVVYAEPHFVHRIEATPNDPDWIYQMRYFVGYPVPAVRMQFSEAWDVVRAQDGDVVVAIVDGGTDWDHPDLAANIWINPGEIEGNGLDDDGNGFVDDVRGWNFANSSNDPTGLPSTPESAAHGTHVAGIVGAVTNNGIGLAGAAWNPRILPVCTALESADRIIAFGYEGIVYAAANGADIINCSWGGIRQPTRFEQDVITWAWERGSVVVAAAGNHGTSSPHYPSNYDHVLSVGAVNDDDVPASYSGTGFEVDILAQGQGVWSTLPDGRYGYENGTSMAAALASAACALVRTRWPSATPEEVIQRVRATAENVDFLIPLPWDVGLKGHGRLNVFRALTMQTPGIRITGIEVRDEDEDGVVEAGEAATIDLTVTNFLDLATSVTFVLREYSDFASVMHGGAAAPSMQAGTSISLPSLTVKIDPDAPSNYEFIGFLEIVAGSPLYSDLDHVIFRVQPTFVTHDANALQATVTSVGKLGHAIALGGNLYDGIGIRFKHSNDVLSQGSLMLGTSAAQVSDAASSIHYISEDHDWVTAPGGFARLRTPGELSAQESCVRFDDSGASVPLGVLVTQQGYQFASAPDDGYLILKYSIQNTTTTMLSGLHVGWFCDWDVDRTTPLTNRTGFDAVRQLGYVWDEQGGAGGAYFGVRVLTAPGATSYRGIYVDPREPGNTSWGILDGFSSQEKWEALSGGRVFPGVGPADIAHVIATGPFDILPGEAITVAFAIVGGENLPDLQASADAAQLRWEGLPTAVEDYSFNGVATKHGVLLQWRLAPEVVVSLRGVGVQRAVRASGPYLERTGSSLLPPSISMTFEDAFDGAASTVWYRLRLVDHDGQEQVSAPVVVDAGVALDTRLRAIFASSQGPVEIKYTIGSFVERASIQVFDVTGRRVVDLEQGSRAPGTHTTDWDRRGPSGQRVARGLYLVRLVAGGVHSSRKVLLVH